MDWSKCRGKCFWSFIDAASTAIDLREAATDDGQRLNVALHARWAASSFRSPESSSVLMSIMKTLGTPLLNVICMSWIMERCIRKTARISMTPTPSADSTAFD